MALDVERMAHLLDQAIVDPEDTLVVVDFDGTLANIVDDPADAKLIAGARRSLDVLASQVADVAVVSGRPLSFLEAAMAPVDRLSLFGVYGLEFLRDGVRARDARVDAFGDVIADAADEVTSILPSARIEQKLGAVLTIHWREHPEIEPVALALAQTMAERSGLWLFPGRMSVELRVPIPVSKVETVRSLAASRGHVVIAGDDAADLEAMRAVRSMVAAGTCQSMVAVAVDSPEAPPGLIEEADLVVSGPLELVAVLGRTAALLLTRGDLGRV